ncbi:MAG: CRISPR-associated protein Cas4 [Candidatus Korobacteraceae bacterium]
MHSEEWSIPLSAVNQFLYCPRRAALIHVEGIFVDNQHTVLGQLAHEHTDFPGYELAKGVKLLRALPVFSERLGLSGKCDIVEQHSDGSLCPVEYKKGKRRQFENDDAQLCAQALCLEEMFGKTIVGGAIFHAASKRRRDVEFTAQLRKLTEDAVSELHRLVEAGVVPPAVFKPACEECSLYRICLPEVTSRPAALAQAAAQLFRT